MDEKTDDPLPLPVALKIDAVCDKFEESWVAGKLPSIEEFLSSESEPARSALLRGLLEIELEHRAEDDEPPTPTEYLSRFSDYPDLIADVFRSRALAEDAARSVVNPIDNGLGAHADTTPRRIGRHQVVREIGAGGFGTVYLAHDDQLRRQVAIKVPRRGRISEPEDVGTYLGEARVVASLDHPHIVPVYDVGQTEERLCYIVSKYIEGRDLSEQITRKRPSPVESAELIAVVARALHYAHTQGVIHRDLKPSNILIDTDGTPYLADFGLALKDEKFGEEDRYVGAPAYMSPEQARGEGHLVDGRSDVFSLGVVLYELLTGVRPFRGADRRKVIESVKTSEPPPPRQVDGTISKDLERICLKALSKRAADRYATALEMAEDLELSIRSSRVESDATKSSAKGLMVLLSAAAVVAIGWGIIRHWQESNHAEGLVQRLLDARITEVSGIVAELGPYRDWTDPALEQTFQTSSDPGHRLRAGLALLAVGNESVIGEVLQRMLEAEPDEFPVIRDSLAGHQDVLGDELWATVEDSQIHWDQRFRAACALATYAPRDKARWAKLSADIADQLVSVNAVFLDRWIAALRPVANELSSAVTKIFHDSERPELERFSAARVLAEYVGDQVEALANLLVDSDAKQFPVLLDRLERHPDNDDAISRLEAVVRVTESAAGDDGDRHAKRRANAAAALLRMNQSNEVAWSLMRHAADPRARTYLVHQLGRCKVNVDALVTRLKTQKDSTIRAALIVGLGEFPTDQLTETREQELNILLRDLYRNDENRDVHAAAEWLLRRWGRDHQIESIDRELATGQVEGGRQWYINGQGHTMVLLHAGHFPMGSPKSEDYRLLPERQHTRHIDRTFAIASKEVTRSQFERFSRETGIQVDSPHEFSPRLEGPQVSVTWHLAARYCNWLSEQEGIPEEQWCYQRREDDDRADGMRLAAAHLDRTGYRLPTEAEWEFACRGGTLTSRGYGDADELLSHYAWYDDNSRQFAQPVGQLKPNDYGLFDMHGNVWEWTDSRYNEYPERIATDREDLTEVTYDGVRILRGGSWASPVKVVRAAHRYVSVISTPNANHGFRVTRTIGQPE